ncbi:PRAME family member 7 [Myotis brandtii]|uniref:PRAME family member 7 n=1 Tax=Myotis brandtii TaxID=109478 RepID=S7MXQ8_MYOBR|nr:PRAME family member 7 [Myotis brandtii]
MPKAEFQEPGGNIRLVLVTPSVCTSTFSRDCNCRLMGYEGWNCALSGRWPGRSQSQSWGQAPRTTLLLLTLAPLLLLALPLSSTTAETFLQDSFLSTLKMSIQTPPTLLVLTAKRLLRDQASAITALEYLPAELFPDLFVLAYRSGHHCQLLKAMAQAWPFTVLPLGALMQHPPDHAPTSAMGLKAVFDALDVLLAQEIRPR